MTRALFRGALIGLALAATVHGTAIAGQSTPVCDEIAGAPLAQNQNWRVLRVRRPHVIVACRRHSADRLVRVLGRTGVYGPQIQGLVGHRLSLVERTRPGVSPDGYAYTMVDLATGRSAPLGAIGVTASGSTWSRALVLTNGRVVGEDWTGDSDNGSWDAVSSIGPLTSWSAIGKRVQEAAGWALRASAGTKTAAPGAYYTTPEGSVGRLVPPANAGAPATRPDHSLRWRSDLDLRRASVKPDRFAVPEYATGLAMTIVRGGDGRGPRLVFPSSFYGASKVPLANDHVDVLAQGYDQILIAARFADAPSQRRIRLLNTEGAPDLDLPDMPAAHEPGHAVIRGRQLAVALPTEIRLFGANETISVPVAGATDLVVWNGNDILFHRRKRPARTALVWERHELRGLALHAAVSEHLPRRSRRHRAVSADAG